MVIPPGRGLQVGLSVGLQPDDRQNTTNPSG
jgi:hypothetical protein